MRYTAVPLEEGEEMPSLLWTTGRKGICPPLEEREVRRIGSTLLTSLNTKWRILKVSNVGAEIILKEREPNGRRR